MSKRQEARLARFSKICLALPDAVRTDMGDHAQFSVRKKTFAYLLNNHHGDGIVGINCKVLPGDNERLIAVDPERYYMPAYIGVRGWVGLRIDLATVDWDEVAELAAGSYILVAPKTLAAIVRKQFEE